MIHTLRHLPSSYTNACTSTTDITTTSTQMPMLRCCTQHIERMNHSRYEPQQRQQDIDAHQTITGIQVEKDTKRRENQTENGLDKSSKPSHGLLLLLLTAKVTVSKV
eukprot:TRINITY_DN14989_c0_g1_i1.p1 TRINITY_DN14989_c0_g1~~TRINITY_DN14989_c0_g1_i1.p1  ORF type:complete len:107 (+),score=1.21 TRINITY_DN14989_c0_g1_i1:126-446(+)